MSTTTSAVRRGSRRSYACRRPRRPRAGRTRVPRRASRGRRRRCGRCHRARLLSSQARPGAPTRAPRPDTWDDFAALVEANNGVWGGCWCMGFHPEGLGRAPPRTTGAPSGRTPTAGTVHQVLVYDGDACVGLVPVRLARRAAQHQERRRPTSEELADLPDWRIGCIFTGSKHRGKGVARAAVAGGRSTRSARPAAGSSRPTRSRPRTGSRSAAPTSTPARRRCTRSSASSATARSPSGAG